MTETNSESQMSTESDEEECGSFFLKPSSSPYNLAEKVKEANNKLLAQSAEDENRPTKLQFRENLVEYEPESTSDDASSIKSEDDMLDIGYQFIGDRAVMEELIQTSVNFNISKQHHDDEPLSEDSNLDDEIIKEDQLIEEEEQEEIIEDEEEIAEDVSEIEELTAVKCLDLGVHFSNKDPEPEEEILEGGETQNQLKKGKQNKKSKKSSKKHTFGHSRKTIKKIDCKKHCIEHFGDSNTPTNASAAKPFTNVCPILKLRQRGCCENNTCKLQSKLPKYAGLKSEYGLSSQQLRNRDISIQRRQSYEQERGKLLEEQECRRIEKNEEIFCDWLKSVWHRKQISDESKRQNFKKTCNYNVRPKTANPTYSNRNEKLSLKKRPSSTSTSSRIFIEVSPSIINDGLTVGDIFVNKKTSKPLNIVALV